MPRSPFGDLIVAASYFDRKFDYEADATDVLSSCSSRAAYVHLRLRRRSARFRDEPREHAHHDRGGAPAVQQRRREPLVLDRRRVLQPRGRAHAVRQLRARLREHAGLRVLRVPGVLSTTARWRPPRQWFLGRLRDRARAARGVRRDRVRRHRELHDHGGRALVRVRPDLQPAPGGAGRIQRLLADRCQHANEG